VFLRQGLGGLTALSLQGSAAAFETRGAADVTAGPGPRIDLRQRIFNGQDLQLARFLETSTACRHPGYAMLVRAGARLAEALAWALAPSGAVETWRLDELASRRGPDLLTGDDPAIHRDRDEADRRFRDALRIVLPGTEFFRLYVDRLRPDVLAVLGRTAVARLTRMAGSEVLTGADVEFLMSPDGPDRAVAVRVLHAFRRYTYYRYLVTRELVQGAAVDLFVPAMAPRACEPGSGAPPTPLRDRVEALARIVRLSGGRVHPLAPFVPDAIDALGLVRDAVEHLGFVGVSVSRRIPRALRAWCEERDVPIVAGDARLPSERDAASFFGLQRGRGPRVRLERFYERHRMVAPGWMRRLDEAT
jgi:hypothetical protein